MFLWLWVTVVVVSFPTPAPCRPFLDTRRLFIYREKTVPLGPVHMLKKKGAASPTAMSSSLRQLNISYNPLEDRLLMRISSGSPGTLEEYRLWLTRRFVSLLWKALEQIIDSDSTLNPAVSADNRPALKEFRQEAALASSDFKTPYKAEAASTPLGPAPLLVSKLAVRKGPRDIHVLSLSAAKGQTINLNLSIPLIHSIQKLLADAVARNGWGLSFSTPPPEAPPSTDAPPRTLN